MLDKSYSVLKSHDHSESDFSSGLANLSNALMGSFRLLRQTSSSVTWCSTTVISLGTALPYIPDCLTPDRQCRLTVSLPTILPIHCQQALSKTALGRCILQKLARADFFNATKKREVEGLFLLSQIE